MGGKNTILTKFPLAGTKNGMISVSHLEEPYGNGSFPVVSIGIALKKVGKNLIGKHIFLMRILMNLLVLFKMQKHVLEQRQNNI